MPNRELFALLIQEGTKIVSTLIATRRPKLPHPTLEIDVLEEGPSRPQPATAEETEGKATAIATGCIPCSLGHIGTCSGILNEAMRFARSDGIASEEVIDRVGICLDELNSLEREDLRPEMIHDLPEWEKKIAIDALNTSRSMRHSLENISSVDGLESVAAATQTSRRDIGRRWFQHRLSTMAPEEREATRVAVEKVLQEESEDNE